MADEKKPAPRQPDYSVNCLNKQNEVKGKIGAAWLNEDDSIRIVLDPFVVLPASHLAVITLFKVGSYNKKPETKPTGSRPSTEPFSADAAGEDGYPGRKPQDEVPF